MERIAKTLAAATLVLLLAACGTAPVVTRIVEAPKPTVDARIMQLCELTLTPVSVDPAPSPEELFVSYGEAIDLLNACACRQRETRNALCQTTAPGCAPVKPCEKPKNDTSPK